jgi:hypothetical protein
MSDERIDDMLRELRDDLMAVRPSPEFAAKLRQQVAARPARNWFGIWHVAMAASVVALAALAIVLWPSQATKHDAPAPGVIAAQNPPTPLAPAASSTTVAPTGAVNQTTPRHAVVTQPARVQRVAAREPEVLVPGDQRTALIGLLASMRSRGTQVPQETEVAVDSEGRLPVPAAIRVSPITIEPLGPPVPGGGSRER